MKCENCNGDIKHSHEDVYECVYCGEKTDQNGEVVYAI